MANLQVSLVKHYNKIMGRSGTLMAGRFKRRLISSEEEVENLAGELKRGENDHRYEGFWAEMGTKVFEGLSGNYVEFKKKNGKYWAEFNGLNFDLVTQFMESQKIENYPPPIYLHRRFFKSCCKYHKLL